MASKRTGRARSKGSNSALAMAWWWNARLRTNSVYAYKLPQKFVALRLNLFTQKKSYRNKFVAVDSLEFTAQKLLNLQSSCSFEHRF